MSLFIDIIIVAIILLCVFFGYKKGLIGEAFSIVSFIAALVIAFILFIPISAFVIDNMEFDESIKTAIVNNFSAEISSETDVESETNQPNDEDEKSFITNFIDEQLKENANNTVEIVATEISEICIKGIVFILLFIVARIGLIFAKFIANLIAKLPILAQFNKVGGIVFGLIKGLVITYGILAILLLVSPMFNDTAFFKAMDKSFVGSMMYNNNIIIKILL